MNRRTTAGAVLTLSVLLLCGCRSAQQGAPASPDADTSSGIGAWPTFLPTPAGAGIAHGSETDPALSYAGSPVVIALSTGKATFNLQGPSYPPDTKVGADAVRCTFSVVVSGATSDVDLTTAHFDVLDHNGTTHALKPDTGTSIPALVRPGQTVTLHLVAVVPSGEGLLRYAPDGKHTAAAWDYVAETD